MARRRDDGLEKRPIPEPLYRLPLFWGLPQHYLVVWLATNASAGIAAGNAFGWGIGLLSFVAGMIFVHPRLARACEDDALAIDIVLHWLLYEHAYSEPHPSIWDRPDRVRPSIPER